MQKKEAIQLPSKLGNIAPSPELRISLEGAERCLAFFEKHQLIDYLKSINSHYLESKGEVKGPIKRIASAVPDQDQDISQQCGLDGSWGGIKTLLEWTKPDETITNKTIFLGLFYSHNTDYYQLYLSSSIGQRITTEEGISQTGSSFFRDFHLNPPSIQQGEIDDILMQFTSELIQA